MNLKTVVVFASLLVFGGCTQLGPDFQKRSPKQLPKSWKKDANATQNISNWWQQFHDPVLDKLIDEALQENLDMRSAGLRIMQARAALGVTKGMQYPQMQKLSASLPMGQSNGAGFVNFSTSFDMAWEMDIWGRYARGIESSEAALYASVASYNDIAVRVIAEVARNYINYTTAQQRIAYAKRNILIQERVVHMTQVQFNAGNVSELDVQQAKTQLYATKSALPSLELSKIKARNAIAILLGKLPEDIEKILKQKDFQDTLRVQGENFQNYDYTKDSLIPAIDLPDDFAISADAITQRPDIRVAEYKAHSQSAKIGLSQTALYPHFFLFGTLGYNTTKISSGGFTAASDALQVIAGPGFEWNILQYGRLKNQVRIEDAAFEASLVSYNKKVLQAVSEVSNALSGYKLTKEQLMLNEKTIEATVRAFKISLAQYEQGLVTYQRLLSTVEKLTRSEDVYAVTKGAISLQTIALYKALGGGWKSTVGKSYLHPDDKASMQERDVDWGDYLENNTSMPSESFYE